jgi:hypothetical protein
MSISDIGGFQENFGIAGQIGYGGKLPKNGTLHRTMY